MYCKKINEKMQMKHTLTRNKTLQIHGTVQKMNVLVHNVWERKLPQS